MRIIIGADLVPTQSNIHLFKNCEITELIGSKLVNELNSCDFSIFNLEVPLTDNINPIKKIGRNLSAPTETIKGIKTINPSLLTLANNHILDQGDEGLFSTIKLLDENKINFIGAGKNKNQASKPYIFTKNNMRVGIYACAEHEFTIATDEKPGANPFDEYNSFEDIAKLKNECDYVIVLYHGGKEYYRYTSPELRKRCRRMADKGADLIVCQHSHCIAAYEDYNSSKIIYGQGNFIFDHSSKVETETSILVDIQLEKNNTNINYIPIVKKENRISIADETQKKDILYDFKLRSDQIKSEEFVNQIYSSFAKKSINDYLIKLNGQNLLIRILNKIFLKKIIRRMYNSKSLLAIINIIECESHRELLLRGLKEEV